MPPKRQHGRAQIEQAAFDIAREEGLEHLSARAVAQRLGSSTSPIYSLFRNMQELEDLVCERSVEVMLEYQTRERTGSPLLDMCLGYVLFAVAERQLFRDMFLNKQELSPHSLEMKDVAFRRLTEKMLSREPSIESMEPERKMDILDILWTYAHGLAAQICVGAVPVPEDRVIIDKLDRLIRPLVSAV